LTNSQRKAFDSTNALGLSLGSRQLIKPNRRRFELVEKITILVKAASDARCLGALSPTNKVVMRTGR
jgi:hypothetical protein